MTQQQSHRLCLLVAEDSSSLSYWFKYPRVGENLLCGGGYPGD